MASVPNRSPEVLIEQETHLLKHEQKLLGHIRRDERVYIFIDGSNTYSSARLLGFSIDFGLLRQLFDRNTRLDRAYYFTALPSEDKQSSLRRQVDWMKHNGYTVVHKPVKEYTNGDRERLLKGNVDVELTVVAMNHCFADHADHFVLFTGDGDFRSLVEALQNRGKRVTCISTVKTAPSLASDDLRKQTDYFIDLADLRPFIERRSTRSSLNGEYIEAGTTA
jgi:uncharacterized LabA/DUF88 family protein